MPQDNYTRVDEIRLDRLRCPDCEEGYQYGRRIVPPRRPRPFVVSWFQEWYGWHYTCLRCGCQWADGEILPRPFEPRWRENNCERARKHWRKYRRTEVAE